jgi:hypothetical protein
MKQFIKRNFTQSLEIFVRFFIWLFLILACEYFAGKVISEQIKTNAAYFLLASGATSLGLFMVLALIRQSNLVSHSVLVDLQRLYVADLVLQLVCAALWYCRVDIHFWYWANAFLYALRNLRLVWWAKDEAGNFVSWPLPLTNSATGTTRQALAACLMMLGAAMLAPFLQESIHERSGLQIVIAPIGLAIVLLCKQAYKEFNLYLSRSAQIEHELVWQTSEIEKLTDLLKARPDITSRERLLIDAASAIPDDAFLDLVKIAREFNRQSANKPAAPKLVGGTDFEKRRASIGDARLE